MSKQTMLSVLASDIVEAQSDLNDAIDKEDYTRTVVISSVICNLVRLKTLLQDGQADVSKVISELTNANFVGRVYSLPEYMTYGESIKYRYFKAIDEVLEERDNEAETLCDKYMRSVWRHYAELIHKHCSTV